MAGEELGMLIGAAVGAVEISGLVRLHLDDGPYPDKRITCSMDVEVPFLLRDADGTWHEIRPGVVETLAPLVMLYRQEVRSATFDGEFLEIEFDQGWMMKVTTADHYESWHLTGKGVPLIVVAGGYLLKARRDKGK